MEVVSFFCGTGGLDLGFMQAGYEIKIAYDWDKWACLSYAHNVDERVQNISITNLKGTDIPKSNGWLFGFPCKDISIAKKDREKLEGGQSGLFYEVMRLLDEVENKPDFILAENVEQVAELFPIIEKEYAKRGYSFSYQLFNTLDFGIPQNRPRYFMVGFKDESIKMKFITSPSIQYPSLSSYLDKDVPEKYYMDKDYILFDNQKKNVIGQVQMKSLESLKRIYSLNGYAPTLTSCQGGHRQPKVIDDEGLRKLTPTEFARLQGFPDSYEIIVSDTQAYNQLGNAVTVAVGKHVGESIKLSMTKEEVR